MRKSTGHGSRGRMFAAAGNQLTLRKKHAEYRKTFDQMVAEGYIKPLSEWDLEELSRGQPRNRGGGWQGKKPVWLVGAPVKQEISRRFKEEAVSHLVRYFPKALQTLADLLDEDDPAIRLKACSLLLEYAIGKPTVHTHVSADEGVKGMLAAALVMPTGEPAHPVHHEILEGEVLPDD